MMGGYQRSTLKLVFDDPELAGLEVKARRMRIGELLELAKARSINPNSAEDLEKILTISEVVSRALLAWNLEDDEGEPVPLGPQALAAQDLGLMLAVAEALADASAAVSRPLPRPSADGGQSLEQSLPMEVVSPSPENSPEPG